MANIKHQMLSAQTVKALTEPGSYTDGQTLTLRVSENGKKRWIQRISINGKQHNLGLGGYPAVGLAEARQRTQENLRAVREGRDPLQEKRDAVQATKKKNTTPTFREMAAEEIQRRSPNWKGTKSLNRFRLLIAYHSSAGGLPPHPKRYKQAEPFKALPYAQMPSAIETIRNSSADLLTKLGLEFKILTAARTAEVRFADWSEFDIEEKLRTITADDMKMSRDHRIPLSDRAITILGEARYLTGGTGLVFPNERTRKKGVPKPLSDAAFSRLLDRIGVDSSPHGFRSSFKDWAREKQVSSDLPSEFALSHVEGSQAKRAYARTDLLETRRGLMQNWAHFCSTGETLPFQWEDAELQMLSIMS